MRFIQQNNKPVRKKRESGKSIRHPKINIELNGKEELSKFSYVLNAIGIRTSEFTNIIEKITDREDKKVRWALSKDEYQQIKEYAFLLKTFGFQATQIAYLMGNQITASVLSRYIKEEHGADIEQKTITCHLIAQDDTGKDYLVKWLKPETKVPVKALLDQKMFFCKLGTKKRVSLKNVKRSKTTESRKK